MAEGSISPESILIQDRRPAIGREYPGVHFIYHKVATRDEVMEMPSFKRARYSDGPNTPYV